MQSLSFVPTTKEPESIILSVIVCQFNPKYFMPKYPYIGPDPLILQRKQVDALYDTLELLIGYLDRLAVRYCLIAGSLLGAVRSQSILFNDDDIDIAIFDFELPPGSEYKTEYRRMLALLPPLLGQDAIYQIRPWEACDRVRPCKSNGVFIDIFVLRRYESMEGIIAVVEIKANGQPQTTAYVERITDVIRTQHHKEGVEPLFPLWSFDNRKSIELWPHEYYRESDIFPITRGLTFGPLMNVCGPKKPIKILHRFYNSSCFDVYYAVTAHTSNGGNWSEGKILSLEDKHFLPVQHSSRSKRIWSEHCKATLQIYLEQQAALEQER